METFGMTDYITNKLWCNAWNATDKKGKGIGESQLVIAVEWWVSFSNFSVLGVWSRKLVGTATHPKVVGPDNLQSMQDKSANTHYSIFPWAFFQSSCYYPKPMLKCFWNFEYELGQHSWHGLSVLLIKGLKMKKTKSFTFCLQRFFFF